MDGRWRLGGGSLETERYYTIYDGLLFHVARFLSEFGRVAIICHMRSIVIFVKLSE